MVLALILKLMPQYCFQPHYRQLGRHLYHRSMHYSENRECQILIQLEVQSFFWKIFEEYCLFYPHRMDHL